MRSFQTSSPTTQMLGRYQPFHDGHKALFVRALAKTGQVVIMVRQMPKSDKNPYDYSEVKLKIRQKLKDYKYMQDYIIVPVPNIVNITYGRDVGYAIEQEKFSKEIEDISATKIRAQS